MTNTPENYNRKYQEAIRKLADGYSDNFAEFCAADERLHEILMDLAAVFVTEELPIVSEDSQLDMATELIMSVTIRPV